MKQWSVPFITKTTEVWEVFAANKSQATFLATLARERYLAALADSDLENVSTVHPDRPTHRHSEASIGTTAATITDETTVPGGLPGV